MEARIASWNWIFKHYPANPRTKIFFNVGTLWGASFTIYYKDCNILNTIFYGPSPRFSFCFVPWFGEVSQHTVSMIQIRRVCTWPRLKYGLCMHLFWIHQSIQVGIWAWCCRVDINCFTISAIRPLLLRIKICFSNLFNSIF